MDLTTRMRSTFKMLERDHGLVPVIVWEAGSRSWGYSTDKSDYDLRFVYIKKPWMGTVTNTDDTYRDDITFTDGMRFELQGFDLRKFMGMLTRSDAFIHEILAGGTMLAVGGGLKHIAPVAEKYIDKRAICDAFYAQVRRNLMPKRSNKLTSKGVIHALRYAIMTEQMLDTYEIRPNLQVRDDMHNYSAFGSASAVQYTIQHLRDNPDLTQDQLHADPIVRDVFKFSEVLDRRVKYDLEKVPGGRTRDYTEADLHFQAILRHYYHFQLEVQLNWIDGIHYTSLVRSK